MNFLKLTFWLKNHKQQLSNMLWYASVVLLAATLICFGLLFLRVNSQRKDLLAQDDIIVAHHTGSFGTLESRVQSYKKKIEDFTILIDQHKISLNMFKLIEEKTLPTVWFSNITVSEFKDSATLSGNAKTMEDISKQVHIFEQSRGLVKTAMLVSSQVDDKTGNIEFLFTIDFEPSVFSYLDSLPPLPPANSAKQSSQGSNLALVSYRNTDKGFTMNVPEAWQAGVGQTPDTIVVFSNPTPDTDNNQSFTTNLVVTSGPAKNLDLKKYVLLQEQGLAKVLEGWKLQESKPVHQTGIDGYSITGTFLRNGTELKSLQFITVKDNIAYLVTATSLSKNYDDYLQTFTSSLTSFSFL